MSGRNLRNTCMVWEVRAKYTGAGPIGPHCFVRTQSRAAYLAAFLNRLDSPEIATYDVRRRRVRRGDGLIR